MVCTNYAKTEVKHVERKKPLPCCLPGELLGNVGKCLNGRCESSAYDGPGASQRALYRKLIIKAREFTITQHVEPPGKLKLTIKYVWPGGDSYSSYEDDDILCEGDFIQVTRLTRTLYRVRFDLVCKTLLVHKDSSIKFIAADDKLDRPKIRRHWYEGVKRLRELKSGSIDLGDTEGEDILKYELEALRSWD